MWCFVNFDCCFAFFVSETKKNTGLESGKGNSAVGSPDYMAVEILRGGQYTFSVDFWSIGVIFYEMLAGLPPFYAPSPVAIFSNILEFKTTLKFPELTAGGEEEGEEEEQEQQPCMSSGAWRLIRALLADPAARLGKDGKEETNIQVLLISKKKLFNRNKRCGASEATRIFCGR
jgi:serine/threonine protein kinase